MARLIEDLLDITRIDAGTLHIEREPLDPAQIVADAGDLMRPLTAEKTMRFELELDGQPLPPVDADRDRVLQVFSNLIGNAIKFTPSGGCITVGAEPRDENVCFSVQDTGPGILEEHIARIFDRFWQGKIAERQGAGLGLAISKGIVEKHGGTIWVESELGFGTTVFFTLPRSGHALAEAGEPH
jgi:signal transduction histidine kinase